MAKQFEWTEELASVPLPPFRGEGKAPKASKPVDTVKFLGPVATSLAPHVAPSYKPRASLVKLATEGKGSFVDEADALIVLAGTGVDGPFKGQITMVPDAVAKKIIHQGVDRWVHVHGLPGAVEIFGYLGAWKPYDLMSGPAYTKIVARKYLRHVIAHHADYDAALARAEQIAAGGGMKAFQKTKVDATYEALAYLFPDHQPFFDAAVQALETSGEESRWLLASARTEADIRAIPELGHFDLEDHALVIPKVMKAAGGPFLVELATKFDSNVGVALALTAYPTSAVADVLARFAEHKETHKVLTAFFQDHPELVKSLEAVTKNDDNKWLKKYATKILAAVKKK